MKRRLIALLLCICMIGSMTVRAVGDETELTCTCGTETEEHGADCALSAAPANDPVCPGDDSCTIEGCENHNVDASTACEECGVADGHAETCSQYAAEETVSAVADQLMAAESVEEMYALVLSLMDTEPEELRALTTDELQTLYNRVNELDPEQNSEDYTDLCDTLQFLAGEYELVGNPVVLANITASSSEWGGTYNVVPTDGITMPVGNVTITLVGTNTTWFDGPIKIPNGSHVTIRGSGLLRRGGVNERELFNIHDGGSLTIVGSSKDSVLIHGLDNKNLTTKGTMIRCDGDLTLENCKLYENTSTYQRDTKVTATDATADNFVGGAITLCDNNNHVIIKNCTFLDNQATWGGAIYLCRTGSGTLTIENTLFDNCDSTYGGGAIFFDGEPGSDTTRPSGGYLDYTVAITDTTIQNCDSGYCGSAIYMHKQGVATITMTRCTVQNCVSNASSCGTIRCDGSSSYKLTVDDCLIQNNASKGHGGGIYWNALGDGAELVVKDSRILNNTASSMGGGMFVEGSYMEVTNTIIKGNSANMGGGIGIKTFSDSGYKNDPSVTGTSFNLTLGNGVIIESNTAATMGGGIAYKIETGVPASGFVFNYTNDGAIIRNNSVTAESGVGGGIAIIESLDTNVSAFDNQKKSYTANTFIKSGEISNNVARDGGAVHITIGNFEMTGGTIKNHTVSGDGAGVYLTGGNFTLKGGDFTDNSATGNGGAAHVTGGSFTMSGGNLVDNSATNGAAAYITGGNFAMSGGIIQANTASTNGGAVYVNSGDVTMTGGSIEQNSATNGAGVYVTDGAFNMISGSLTNNVATSHGGGAYVHGGNITIGVKDCAATNTNHSVTHTDLTHPIVYNNDASFGGGLAADGGVVNIYCGKIITNTADNGGMGHNIFMYDADKTDDDKPVLNHIKGQVGEDTDHGMVVIGGELNIPYEEGQMRITINYHDNGEDLIFEVWVSEAPEEYYLNLPYCPDEWESTQSSNGYTFAGWTYDMDGDRFVDEIVDLSFIRDKADYNALGDPVMIKKVDWKQAAEGGYYIDFYAVWAPIANNVSYEIDLENYGAAADDLGKAMTDEQKTGNTQSYTFSQTVSATITMTNPSIPGYTFKGWRITPSKDEISNWSIIHADKTTEEDVFYAVGTVSGTAALAGYGYEYKDGKFILTTDRNFGDLTLTAVFEEQTADYTYILVGPEKATNFGTMTAQGASENYTTATENKQYTVTIGKVTGNPGSATATAKYGFKLKDPNGWFTNKEGTAAVDSAWVNEGTLTPAKVNNLYEGGTFYAVIEYHLADLIISKTATGSFGNSKDVIADQTFIFEVYQGSKLLTTITLKSGETVTIKDLTIGTTYTVKEIGGWSWRFDATEKERTMVPVVEGAENTNVVDFTNTHINNYWISDEDVILNKRKSK